MKIRESVMFCLLAACFVASCLSLCIFTINVCSSSNCIDEWNISEAADDEVFALLRQTGVGKYELTILGEGRMKSFSRSSPPPWSQYEDLINSVVIKSGVENLSSYSINKCNFLSTITVENPYIEIASETMNLSYMTQVLCHRISTAKAMVYENYPDRLSYICEFENSSCKICAYQCTSHTGGESTCEAVAKCEICHAEYGEKREHRPGKVIPEKPATCDSDGTLAHKVCEYCSAIFNESGELVTENELVIPASHKYSELFEYAKPTCTEEGIIQHYRCERCDKNFNENYIEIDTVLIAPAGHIGGKATCTECAICEVCNLHYGVTDAQNHTFSPNMKYNSQNHWKECECGAVSDFFAHTYIETLLKEPTETEEGVTVLSCECGYSTERAEPHLSPSVTPSEDTPGNKSKIMTVTLVCGTLMSVAAAITVLTFFKKKGKK